MSDYLTHLTNRITQGGDVQPRPKSRFESFQPVDDTQEDQMVQESSSVSSPASKMMQQPLDMTVEPKTAVSAQPPQAEQHETPSVHQIVNHIYNSSPQTVNEAPIIEQNTIFQSSPTQAESIEAPLNGPAMLEKETIVERTTPLQTIVAHHHPAEQMVERPFIPPDPIPNKSTHKTKKVPSVIEKETSLETETIVEKHHINTIQPNRPIQQIVMSPVANVSSRRSETAVSQPEPTINVTIGRIEVKANTPPTPAPSAKPSKKAPIMTLDEYLKRGRGGGA